MCLTHPPCEIAAMQHLSDLCNTCQTMLAPYQCCHHDSPEGFDFEPGSGSLPQPFAVMELICLAPALMHF